LCGSLEARLYVCHRLQDECLNEYWKEIHLEHHGPEGEYSEAKEAYEHEDIETSDEEKEKEKEKDDSIHEKESASEN
jgi:hypothetical protein